LQKINSTLFAQTHSYTKYYRFGTHLFVKVPCPGGSEGTSSVFESSCHHSNYSKVDAIPKSALHMRKDTTSELAELSSHYPFFMLKVKQGSCEYQLWMFFDLTQQGNQTQVYRLWGRHSSH